MKITPEWLEKKIETEPEIPFEVNIAGYDKWKLKQSFNSEEFLELLEKSKTLIDAKYEFIR